MAKKKQERRCSIRNNTAFSLKVSIDRGNRKDAQEHQLVKPGATLETTIVKSGCSSVRFVPTTDKEKQSGSDIAQLQDEAVINCVLPPKIVLRKGCRRIDAYKAKEGRFQTFVSVDERRDVSIVAMPARNMSSWMTSIPSTTSLSDLTLPGSHESCSLHGWPISTCQSLPISSQLSRGIRFLDLRLSLPSGPHGALKAYHGIQPEFISFTDVLKQVYAFLDEHGTETVVLSVKQEDKTEGFEEAVYKLVREQEKRWWVAPLMPKLGDVRGKAVMFSRFGNRSINGIHLPRWPDNSSSIWTTSVPGVNVAVQDWYDIGSIVKIPEKSNLVISSLHLALPSPSAPSTVPSPSQPTRPSDVDQRPWMISFLSASSLLLAFPNICAKGFGWPAWGVGVEGINSRVGRWLTAGEAGDREGKRGGRGGEGGGVGGRGGGGGKVKGAVVLMDFVEFPDDTLVPLLVNCNF